MSEFSEWHRRTDRGLSEFLDRAQWATTSDSVHRLHNHTAGRRETDPFLGRTKAFRPEARKTGIPPVVESDGRGRFTHSHQSFAHPDDRRSPRRERYNRPSQNDSDSDAGSDDDSEIASSRSGESSRSSSFSDNESTRKSGHKLEVVDGSGAEGM